MTFLMKKGDASQSFGDRSELSAPLKPDAQAKNRLPNPFACASGFNGARAFLPLVLLSVVDFVLLSGIAEVAVADVAEAFLFDPPGL